MNTLRDQIKWEQSMISFGVQRFRNQEDKAVGRKDYTGTNGGKRLLKGYLAQVSEFIAHYCAGNGPGGRRRSKYAKLVDTVAPDKLALFALSEIIKAVYEDVGVTQVSHHIGVMLEDELKFTQFELAHPDLFSALQRDLDSRNSENYRHRHRVLTHAMNKSNVEWQAWSNATLVGAGSLVLSLTLDATDMVYKETVRLGRTSKVILRATDEVRDWIERSDEALAVMVPDRMPCLVPPEDWSDPWTGGYHLPRLRNSTALVKVRRGFSKAPAEKLLAEADFSLVRAAVNSMQKTPWRINKPVLSALQAVWAANLGVGMPPSEPYEVPKAPFEKGRVLTDAQQERLNDWKAEAREVYALEQKRQSLVLGVSRTMRVGQMLSAHEVMYYVYQLDFRARIYSATSGVSPQGSDAAKAVLEFATGRAITERGRYWLSVHGANKYGEDKGSYDERVAWIDARRDKWLAVSSDPVGYREHWKDADKPYQFLAFCIEYAGAVAGGDTFVSRLPIAMDGSCNGLQHFSAMLSDSVGGRAVNLTRSEVPSDIYQDVADVVTRKLRSIASGAALGEDEAGRRVAAQNWLGLFKSLGYEGMPRKASKKPVMTLPYGSTQQACTSSLFGWYLEQQVDYFPDGTNFKHCIFLSKVLWSSISEVVVAARSAMDWVQRSAAIIAKEGHPLIYTSPLGFPVYQGSRKNDVLRVASRVGGARMRLNVVVERDEIDSRKQRQGSSPNLVHHCDATHEMMVVNAAAKEGITDFAMIHDDFGTNACYIDRWHEIIREQFVILHTENDILQRFKDEQTARTGVELPELPPRGDLDITEVLKSPYFFG